MVAEFEALESRLWSILEPYRGRLEAGSIYGLQTVKRRSRRGVAMRT